MTGGTCGAGRGTTRGALLGLGLGLLLIVASTGPARAGGISSRAFKGLQARSVKAVKEENWTEVATVISELSSDNSRKAVKWIIKLLEKSKGSSEVFSAAERGFDGMSDKGALKEMRSEIRKSKDWHTRAMLINVARKRGKPDDHEALIKAITDKNAIVATNAIRALCGARVESAVEPMIEAMEKLDSNREPPWAELRLSLGELFAKELEAGADYRSWWTVLKGKGGLKAVSESDREAFRRDAAAAKRAERGGMSSAVKLFGSEIVCSRIVFILDVSGSMRTIDPDDGRVSEPQGSVAKGPPDPNKPDPRLRIERAKRELIRVIKALPASTHVNIMAYSTSVSLWKVEGLHKLTAKNKTDAVEFISKFQAKGVTATDAALRSAFKISGARCFYLLSDGKPSMGEGADIPPQSIHDLVEAENKVLKIRIFTLGFRGADTAFMRELAKQTGGKYSDIR